MYNKLIRNLVIALFMAALALCIFCRGAQSEADEYTVGVVEIVPPEKYVVIEDRKNDKKMLFKKDDYGELDDKDFKFVETVLLKGIEYRYRLIPGDIELKTEEFELIDIDEGKAVLKRDYIDSPAEIQEEMIVEEETAQMPEELEVLQEEEVSKAITAKRLASELFFKIESTKMAEHEWEIALSTILDAAENFGYVLGLVTKKLTDLIEPEKSTSIYFKTSIGKVVLGPSGLLVDSLNSRLKTNFGIEDDDIIQSANGKGLTTIQDISSLFSGMDISSPKTITLKILRDEEELTQVYYLK